ncbi:unnamed protein product [Allacma fusca]|uniref:Uncharacterized protein n=1 Tax=Allacma fusca TaxID=39272 RepID=A0A8J2Q0R3_9HEXA|nr:unnamed protein product [Allacma fusca]
MFGFFFNKKSKSFDKESGKSGGNGKKSKDGKENPSELTIPLKSQNSGSNSDTNSSGEFALSSTTDSEKESEASDLQGSHSTGSLPPCHRFSNIERAFNLHDDIPFHDDDVDDVQEPACQDGVDPKKVKSFTLDKYKITSSPKQGNDFKVNEPNKVKSDSNVDDKTSQFNSSHKFSLPTPKSEEISKKERDVSESERKTMVQLEEIRSKLLAKETQLSLLQADVNMLTVDRDNKVVEMEGLATQIMVLTVENESALENIQKLEEELTVLRQKNDQLTQDILKKSDQLKNVETTTSKSDKTVTELETKMKGLEDKLKEVETDRSKIIEERDAVESEREEELRALQNALDDAIEAKIKTQNKYEREFEELRTTNSSQEQQLMEDFEWKLREIEASCKKKLQEKDRQVEEKLKEAKVLEVQEVGAEREQLRQERRFVEEQMQQVNHLKSYEAEVVQLRGVVHEQQKALRAASRQLEHFKLNDKLLQDEIRTLRVSLEKEKAHAQVMQASSQRRLDAQEESLQCKLDKQKNELNATWEDRLRVECSRLKEDLGKLHAEEKHSAVETMKIQKDQEMSLTKQTWEKQKEQLLQDISKLKDKITEKDSQYHRAVEKVTTQADRDGWEMRRQLEKLSSAHIEQLEQLRESHSEEIEKLQEAQERDLARILELEKKIENYENMKKEAEAAAVPQNDVPAQVVSVQATPTKPNDSSSESDADEEDDEEAETTEDSNESEEETTSSKEVLPNGIDGLRKEVATLQGSIEKLTSELTQESETNTGTSLSTSASTSATSQSCLSEAPSSGMTSESSDLTFSPFLLIGLIPLISYLLFRSFLVIFWAMLVLIALHLTRNENPKSSNSTLFLIKNGTPIASPQTGKMGNSNYKLSDVSRGALDLRPFHFKRDILQKVDATAAEEGENKLL